MTAVADLENTFIAHVRPAPTAEPRAFGERAEHVQLPQRRGGLLDFAQPPDDFLAHLEEQIVFELRASFLGAEDLALHLFQLRRDETLAGRHGLLAMIMRRHLVE